jgi:putative ABC transport system ATP-binding protein
MQVRSRNRSLRLCPVHPKEELRWGAPSIHGLSVSAATVASSEEPFVKLSNVSKSYYRGHREIPVLLDTNLAIQRGAFEAIMGPSGSGKTTLLNLISGIDQPSSGRIEVNGVDITHLSEDDLAEWRLNNVGFVFQFYNLVQVLTAFQNVELPLLLSGLSTRQRRERVETVLALVGLEDRQDHYPHQLSGGQEQRVSIARAIVTDPQLIVADEPTGDLDREGSARVIQLLAELHESFNKTIVIVTHDPEIAGHAQITRRIDKGSLASVAAREPAKKEGFAPPARGGAQHESTQAPPSAFLRTVDGRSEP